MWESLSIVVDAQGTGRTAHSHVLWGVILLERLVMLFVWLRELWGLGPRGWHHQPALAEVF